MDDPAGKVVPPSDRGAGHRRPGASHRRALRIGLAVSAAVHIVGLLLYPRVMHLEVGGPAPFRIPSAARPLEGMTVIEVVAVEEADAPARPAEPEQVREVEGPAVRPGVPDLGQPADVGLVAPGPTAAERLRPRAGDPRLWAPLDPMLNELTIEQRLQLEFAWRIAEWQDSLSMAAAAEGALTDWTKTDSQGRKWGISEGQLHLGDITLPLPFSFGMAVGRRDEFRRKAWEWEEIQRGSATGELRDSWKDRARAIRERRDRERAKVKPDTSGVRR
jgi:hypothetical protein